MGDTTRISWAKRTWNPWIGCRHVSPECDNCYAEKRINTLRGTPENPRPFDTVVRTKTWNDPIRWQREASAEGRVDLVFTCSFSDFFIQQADEWRPEVWRIIKNTPNMLYQILTKRPELISKRLPSDWGACGYANVWLGVSVGLTKYLNRMDALCKIPAAARFVSAEPLLEDICPELEKHIDGIHQIIVGGESGNNSDNFRAMPHEWAERILKVCRRHGVAFFFKQSAARKTELGIELIQTDGTKKEIHEYPEHYAVYQKSMKGLFA